MSDEKQTEAILQRLRDERAIANNDGKHPILERSFALAIDEIERLIRNRDMWKGQVERQAAALTSLRASQAALVEAFKNSADALERLAFSMPPPNAYTPQFVMLANGMRAALAQSQERTPTKCIECDSNFADPPSKLCPGCQAYREHQR